MWTLLLSCQGAALSNFFFSFLKIKYIPVTFLCCFCLRVQSLFLWLGFINSLLGSCCSAQDTNCGVFSTYSDHPSWRDVFQFPSLEIGSCGLTSFVTACCQQAWNPGGSSDRLSPDIARECQTKPQFIMPLLLHLSQSSNEQISFLLLFSVLLPFSMPACKLLPIILYRNHPKSSHTWNFWSWRKGHWSKSLYFWHYL